MNEDREAGPRSPPAAEEPSAGPGDGGSPAPRYRAFVSYSREDADIARWLHRRLERYRIPRSLRGRETPQGTVPARLAPAFLDTAEATPAPELREAIEDALRESRTLVVVCSPAAVRSEWVDREISMFQALGREDRIFCVLAAGEPGAAERGEPERQAFPAAIRDRAAGEEPLAADFREGRSRRELVRLVAGVAGLRFDELFRRERRRRLRRITAGAVGSLIAGVLAVSLFLRVGADFMAQAALEAEDTGRGLELARRAVSWWETPETEEALRELIHRHRERAHVRFPAGLQAADVSLDGRRVAVIDLGGRVALWEPAAAGAPTVAPSATPGVDHLEFSGDGSRVVGWGTGADVHVWDAATGALVVRIPTRPDLSVAALAPSGDRLVTGDEEGGVRVWDVGEESRVTVLQGHEGPVLHAAFGPEGRRVATAGRDRTARVFDVETGAPVTLRGHSGDVAHVAFDPTGARVVTSSYDRTARVWDARTGALVFATAEHDDRVVRSRFSPDGGLVASLTEVGLEHTADPSVSFRDAATGTLVGRFQGHDDRILDVDFDPERRLIVTVSRNRAHVWLDPRETQGVLLATLGSENDRILTVGFSGAGRSALVAAGAGGSLRIWDWRDLLQPSVLAMPSRGLAFMPSGDRILTGGEDGTVRIWDPGSGTVEASLPGHEARVVAVAVSRDGGTVVTGSEDGTARVWALAECEPIGSGRAPPCAPRSVLAGNGGSLVRVAFHGDAPNVATADEDGGVVVWDARTGSRMDSLDTGAPIDGLAVAPGGTRLVIASGPRALVWSPGSGRGPVVLDHDGWVGHAAFSPAGTYVVTASDDATARIWNADSGSALQSLDHEAPVLHAAWHPSGDLVVTASLDGTARVWRAEDGTLRAALREDGQAVRWVGVTPDGGRVITGGDDGRIRLWSIDGSESMVVPGSGDPVDVARIGPDGEWLATASDRNLIVRAYALPLERLVRHADSLLATHREAIVGAPAGDAPPSPPPS